MSQRIPLVILQEMLDSINAIKTYMQGIGEATFSQQPLIQDAVIRRIEIIGEAANQLPTSWKAQHPSIPWQTITDMRNRLIHGYFQIRSDIVWRTVAADLPLLEQQPGTVIAQLSTP